MAWPPLPQPWLLHPMAVHFPIALLTVGLLAQAAALRARSEAPRQAALWLLWAGTLAAWAALGLGLLAESTVPHVPEAWRVMLAHKHLAFWTAGLFTALSLFAVVIERRRQSPAWGRLLFLGWLAAAVVLVATAYHGGELVYTFGVGTAPTAEP